MVRLSSRVWVIYQDKKRSEHFISFTLLQRISLPYTAFTRRYLQYLVWFLFLQVLRRFNSLRLAILTDSMVKSHSGIPGSKAACAYPVHIVACHALLRHYEPSHPPNSRCNPPMYGFINNRENMPCGMVQSQWLFHLKTNIPNVDPVHLLISVNMIRKKHIVFLRPKNYF